MNMNIVTWQHRKGFPVACRVARDGHRMEVRHTIIAEEKTKHWK